jgi:hypothetical protein
MKRSFFSIWILTLAANFAWGQSLPLQLNDQNVKLGSEGGGVVMQIDLLAVLRQQHGAAVPAGLVEIKSITVEAKARMGGGQIMLKVQRDKGAARFVDLKRVETDPAIFDTNEGFQQVELVNFERSLTGAELVVVSGVRLRNLQVVLGAGEDLKILGTYAGFDGTKVAGARSSQTLAGVAAPPNLPIVVVPEVRQPAPVVRAEENKVVPQREQSRVRTARCLQKFCVGQAVYHLRTDWEGVILRIDTRKNQVIVKFGEYTEAFEAAVSPRDLGFN